MNMRTPRDRSHQSKQSETDQWRLFAAVPLPAAVRDLICEIQSDLAAAGWHYRWVQPDLAHITLKFYGDTSPKQRESLALNLANVATTHDSLTLTTAQLGAFPNARRPRIAWLGLDGKLDDLADMAQAIDQASVNAGFKQERRPFQAHITLGRLRERDDQPGDFARTISRITVPRVDVPIDYIQLIRSTLGSGGPTYSVIGEWRIGRSGRPPREHEYG